MPRYRKKPLAQLEHGTRIYAPSPSETRYRVVGPSDIEGGDGPARAVVDGGCAGPAPGRHALDAIRGCSGLPAQRGQQLVHRRAGDRRLGTCGRVHFHRAERWASRRSTPWPAPGWHPRTARTPRSRVCNEPTEARRRVGLPF